MIIRGMSCLSNHEFVHFFYRESSVALRFLWVFLVGALLLGCESYDKEHLKGHRISALTLDMQLKQDINTDSIAIDLPPAEPITSWPQRGGNAQHAPVHAKAQGLGKILWQESIGYGNRAAGFLVASPVGGDGVLYTLDSSHEVRAFDAKTGHEKWSKSIETEQRSKFLGGGVAYEPGFLYVALSSGDILKLNTKDGQEVWRVSTPYAIRSEPALKDNKLYIITSNNNLLAFSTQTGERVWQHSGQEESIAVLGGSPPAVWDQTVISPYSSGELFALYARNGYPLWSDSLAVVHGLDSTSMIAQIRALPVVDQGMVFASSQSGIFVAIDLRTGTRVWEKPLGLGSAPIVAGEFLFALTNDNEVICCTRKTGKVAWISQLPQYEDAERKKGRISWVGPLLANGQLIVAGSTKKALAISPQDGSVISELDLPEGVFLPPIAMDDLIYFLTENGKLVAVGAVPKVE